MCSKDRMYMFAKDWRTIEEHRKQIFLHFGLTWSDDFSSHFFSFIFFGGVTHAHMCAYLCSWDIQYINPSKIRSTGWVYRIPYPQLCSTQLSTLRTSYDNNARLFFWTGFWSGWIEKCTCTWEWVSVRGEGDTFWLAHYHSHCIIYTLILFGFYTIILMKGWLRRRLEEP